VLNPVRAGLAAAPEDWPWSSYRATASGRGGPDWLTTRWALERFGEEGARARRAYRRFVREGIKAASPWDDLCAGAFLGGESFLRAMRERIRQESPDQIATATLRPDRPTAREIGAAVAKAAGLSPEAVLDRRANQATYRVAVYLLRRAVSAPRVSQIQRGIEAAGGLGRAFPWATELAHKYKVK
jgi:hypothetical protein